MIVSDRRSQFGKMIVSDRRSQKKVSSLTLNIPNGNFFRILQQCEYSKVSTAQANFKFQQRHLLVTSVTHEKN